MCSSVVALESCWREKKFEIAKRFQISFFQFLSVRVSSLLQNSVSPPIYAGFAEAVMSPSYSHSAAFAALALV